MISPHIKWLKHGINAETALVGSVVVGRIAFNGDLWAWQASLPHGDLMTDMVDAKQSDRPRNILKRF
jgi:hypothetical protein